MPVFFLLLVNTGLTTYNNIKWKGQTVKVQIAKPSIFEKLAKERQENNSLLQQQQQQQTALTNETTNNIQSARQDLPLLSLPPVKLRPPATDEELRQRSKKKVSHSKKNITKIYIWFCVWSLFYLFIPQTNSFFVFY